MSSKRSFSRTFLCGAAIGALSLSGAAWAQDATDTDEEVVEVVTETPSTDGEARQEKITVTGSLLRRDEFSSASPIQVITADTASLQGLVDSASILQGSSLASGSTQINNQFGGYVVDGGTGVNTVDLRGCGTTRTLVLINGKRPGPSGSRGSVGAFDFNVLPGSIVQRYDVLKDSGSTIYGSDAVCGVVNVVTRTQVDKPELNVNITQPFDSGGESWEVSGAYGFNFDNGSIALAASYSKYEDLSLGDRSYLNCQSDRVRDPVTGEFLDRVNRSITADGSIGCSNIYFNTAVDQLNGQRLIPSTDGSTVATGDLGSIPGYRPRRNAGYGNSVFGPNGPAFYEDVTEDPRFLTTDAINARELASIYGVGDFDLNIFGGTKSLTEVLFTNRQTTSDGWRQFFPTVGGVISEEAATAFLTPYFGAAGAAYYAPYYTDYFTYANDPNYSNALQSLALPVTLWPSNAKIDVDYLYIAQTFSGDIGSTGWGWSLGGNYSKSDATYTANQIIASRTGDYNYSDDAPTIDYFTPEWLSGNYSQADYEYLTGMDTGNTQYEQWLVNGSVSGDLFSLPAGKVAAAVGFEYRDFSINDTPGEYTQSGDVWNSSTSGITEGSDNVAEIFAEVEIPILKGVPLAEELTVNVSGRAFDYDSFGSDSVYKIGANWQITPSVRLRATQGTSFRAPALFEQYLDAQTGFLNQTSIDPCIDWGSSTNDNLRTNCAAVGIPSNYTGGGASSALIISGGNGDTLEAETSDSFTVGTVFTPTFADINIAVDYYEFEVNDQIGQLGALNILRACYRGEPANFADNTYCDLFSRVPAGQPGQYSVIQVEDTYLNINKQLQRGIDVDVRYEHEFTFGDLVIDGGGTWTLESLYQNFDPGTVVGFDNQDYNGTIGDPNFVGDARIQLDRGDWTYTWATDYVGRTSNARYADTPDGIEEPYFGTLANVDYTAEATVYHHASVRWTGDTWQFTVGVRNIFDEAPPMVSSEAASVRGNVPLVGTQYDLRGRRAFLQVSKTF